MFDFEEKTILSDYRKVFNNHPKQEIIDMDEMLRKKLECFIIPLEKLLKETGFTVSPSRESRFSIIYIKKGRGEKIVGNVPVLIKNRTLIIVPSRIASSSVYKGKDIKGYHMSFTLDCFLKMPFLSDQFITMNLFNSIQAAYYYADLKEGKILDGIFDMLLCELHQRKKNREFLIAGKILELTILCDRVCRVEGKQTNNSHPPLVVQFINLIQEYYKVYHSVTFYANKLFVHPNSLNAVTKRYLGQTAKTTIDSKLLSEAEYLLQKTNLSVKEIAYETGFKSATYFFRFFKKYNGSSPAVYRQKHLNL